MLSLRLVPILFLLFVWWRRPVQASLELYQVEFVQDNPDVIFLVEGVASVPIGGSPPRHFAFNCLSTTTNGQMISWSRADGTSLTMTQNAIANGVQLDFGQPANSDLTVYRCYDGATGQFVMLNVTDENPVAIPVEKDGVIDAFVDDEVVIKFYVASLPPPQPDSISWFFNQSSNIDWGNFSTDKKTLTIPSVQVAHAGEYKFRILLHLFATKYISATATTTVNVVAPAGVTGLPPEVTVLPPGVTVLPPEVTVLPPGVTVLPPGVTGLPPEVTVLPPGVTVLPPEVTVLPPGVTVLPPEVMVFPPVDNVLKDSSSSFECKVTNSVLEYTLNWNFNGSLKLPQGVILVNDSTVLVIPSVQPCHTGTYTCQVNDKVYLRNFSAVLVVNYSPEAIVGLREGVRQFNFSHITDEGGVPPLFFCFYTGHPWPNVTWTLASGEPLPSRIKQTHANPGIHALNFTFGLAYNDPVQFVCTAGNTLGTTTARLELVVRAPPILLTIVPISPVILNTTSPLSFVVPPSHTGLGLTCFARGWPMPEIKWLDQNGQALTSSYQSCEAGVVSASLSLDDNLKQGPVRCVAANPFGEDSQTVQLYVGEAIAPTFSPSSPSETGGSTTVSFTLRLLTSDCLQSDQYALKKEEELQRILLYTVSISGTVCQSLPSSTITITRSFCSSEVDGATVFSGTISASDAAQTQQLYTAMRDWYRSGPVLFLNDTPYAVDLGCDLLLPADTQSECQIDEPPAGINTAIFIVTFVATALCLLVFITIVIFQFCCIHFRKKKGPLNRKTAVKFDCHEYIDTKSNT